MEIETGAPEQSTSLPGSNQVCAGGPPLPGGSIEPQERLGIGDGEMLGPSKQAGNLCVSDGCIRLLCRHIWAFICVYVD